MNGDPTITPEKVLCALLDSRGQAAVVSGNQGGHPTRIRALEALREGILSVAALAKRIEVSRQTAYRALDPGRKAGFIRSLEGGVSLSCSGGAVLKVYHDLCREIDREALVQLARSKHKRWILQTLETVPARKATLASTGQQQGGPSRTTVHRIIDAFVADGYVLERGGAYEVTEMGRLLLSSYTEFRTVIAQALDKREFLRWLPADLESFPVDALADSKVIRNTPKQPHNVLSAFTRIAETNFGRFRGITTIMSPTLANAYYPVLSSETQVNVVFPDEILSQLHADHEFIDFVKEHGFESYIRDGQPAQDSEFMFVPEPLPVHLAICDDTRVILAPSPSTGVPESSASAIDSNDPDIVEWAATFFESFRDKGRPPFRALLKQKMAQGSDPQRRAGD